MPLDFFVQRWLQLFSCFATTPPPPLRQAETPAPDLGQRRCLLRDGASEDHKRDQGCGTGDPPVVRERIERLEFVPSKVVH